MKDNNYYSIKAHQEIFTNLDLAYCSTGELITIRNTINKIIKKRKQKMIDQQNFQNKLDNLIKEMDSMGLKIELNEDDNLEVVTKS